VRRLVVVLLVLVGLLAVADRVALHLAERAVADQARTSAGLSSTPKVTAHGFPFLTQVLRGRYDRIDVELTDLDRGGVRMKELDATLRDVRVPLADALGGKVDSIPVQQLDATALVTFAELAHRSGIVGVTMQPEGDKVRVTGSVRFLGQTVRASALSRVSLRNGRIALNAVSFKLLGQSTPAVAGALTGALDVIVPVGTLPYDLELTSLQVMPEGLRLVARSGPTTLTPEQGR
jgi:hypothetical protein